jgi:hypothetical protein
MDVDSVVVLEVLGAGSRSLTVVQEASVTIPATIARPAIIFVMWIMVISRLSWSSWISFPGERAPAGSRSF